LRLLDRWLIQTELELLSHRTGALGRSVAIDVGVGERAFTTRELRENLAPFGLPVVAVEVDPARARAAAALGLEVIEGPFEALGDRDVPARLVRAMNVLRGYPVTQVARARRSLGAPLLDGGLLVEGSSDGVGSALGARVFRKRRGQLEDEGLLFATDFSRGFAPILFRDVLPRDLRRSVRPGEPIHDFFVAWTLAWSEAREGSRPDPRRAFDLSVKLLARRLPGVSCGEGWLCWAQPRVPA
jgi:hypothetical protein